jgi:hypothetical protein
LEKKAMAGNQFGEHHGQKRHADDELESNHNISTQFKKLRISICPFQTSHEAADQVLDHSSRRGLVNGVEHGQTAAPRPLADYMPVDETKDRIVIHDLDAEIAEIEATEPKTLFLPDIDKKVSAIPRKLLQDQRGNTNNTQMVLYGVPSSISVPKEADAVRKAIIAARARAREKQARELEKEDIAFAISDTDPDRTSDLRETHTMYDPDAMDIS